MPEINPCRKFRAAALFITTLAALVEPAFAQVEAGASEPLTPPPISGRNLAEPDTIQPADVLARVELVRDNVELIRRYMGKTIPADPILHVSDARPRETYSQALNLELRANRLAFEQVRTIRKASATLNTNVRAYDVYRVVDSVLEAVLLVKTDMGIQVAVAEELQSPATDPADVINATVAAGSEINNLLYERTGPSDVFQTVTSAVHIAASLHRGIPNGPGFPEEPPFEPNKSPYHLFTRMTDCFELITQLAREQGIETLVFDIPEERALLVKQNDISDMAFLLLEELSGVHRRIPDAPAFDRAYYPGKKFGAHVYQRAGLLERILKDLQAAHMMAPMSAQ